MLRLSGLPHWLRRAAKRLRQPQDTARCRDLRTCLRHDWPECCRDQREARARLEELRTSPALWPRA